MPDTWREDDDQPSPGGRPDTDTDRRSSWASVAVVSVTVIPNAAMDSPCAYSLSPGSAITGAEFAGESDRSGGFCVCAAATVMPKVAVDSRCPSEAVIVTVCVFTSASAATVPDTHPANVL